MHATHAFPSRLTAEEAGRRAAIRDAVAEDRRRAIARLRALSARAVENAANAFGPERARLEGLAAGYEFAAHEVESGRHLEDRDDG